MIVENKNEAAIRDSSAYKGALTACNGDVYAPSTAGGLEIFTGEKNLIFTFSDRKVLSNRGDVETAIAEMYSEMATSPKERYEKLHRRIHAYDLALKDTAPVKKSA